MAKDKLSREEKKTLQSQPKQGCPQAPAPKGLLEARHTELKHQDLVDEQEGGHHLPPYLPPPGCPVPFVLGSNDCSNC